jgi:hypothetical protein
MDPESGDQPLLDTTKEVAIAVNGEIYNHAELRKRFPKYVHLSLSLSLSHTHTHNRYRVNYVYMMGLRPLSKEHYQDAFESAINGSIVVMFDFLFFVKISEAEIPSTRWFSEGILPILLIPYLVIHFLTPLRHSTQSLLPALYACLISPFSEVTFFASFIGDWMVSLVRVFADFTYTSCYVGTGAFMSHRHIGEQVHMIEQCT